MNFGAKSKSNYFMASLGLIALWGLWHPKYVFLYMVYMVYGVYIYVCVYIYMRVCRYIYQGKTGCEVVNYIAVF